jgi:hypothetical protein
LIFPYELQQMAVGVANHSFPIRKTTMRMAATSLTAIAPYGRLAGWRYLSNPICGVLCSGFIGGTSTSDAIEIIERSLRGSLVECTLAGGQPAFLVEPVACRDVGDRNCAVIDPRCTFAAP